MSVSRVASALLLHVNLLLAVIGGGALVTCARLKWDPTLYVALRELAPREWRALGGLPALAAAALACLPHVAVAALAVRSLPLRRLLLALYCAGTGALMAGEAGAAWWLAGVARGLVRSAAAREALELRDHLRPLLASLARWHPAPHRLQALLEEVEADVPRNGYVACATFALLLLLQALSLALAALLFVRPRSHALPPRFETHHIINDRLNNNVTDAEKAPLKATYRGGRLVLV